MPDTVSAEGSGEMPVQDSWAQNSGSRFEKQACDSSLRKGSGVVVGCQEPVLYTAFASAIRKNWEILGMNFLTSQ